jgi:hypothetical protein
MNGPERRDPARLLDAPPQKDPDEAAAVTLLGRLAPPPPLSAVAEARIGREFAGRARAPRRRAGSLVVAGAVGCVFLLIVTARLARSPTPRRHAPALSPAMVMRPVAPTFLALGSDGRAALLGDSAVERRGDGGLRLVRGRLAVRSGLSPIEIAAAGARVHVPPRALVQIEVTERHVEVAAYSGGARVEWVELGRTEEIPVDPQSPRADEARRLLGASLPPLETSAIDPRSAPERAAPQPHASRRSSARRQESPAPLDPPAGAALRAEAELLSRAVARLRRDRDPGGALAIVEEYRTAFPDGALRPDVARAQIEILLELDRREEALVVLDSMQLPDGDAELRVLRGELRAAAGRCDQALLDFAPMLAAGDPKTGPLDERALYGRASCRTRLGQPTKARTDLERYLQRYPQGRFSAEVLRALGRSR